MKTWLFTWNPSRWAWDDPIYGKEEMSREISRIGESFCKWTCGGTKSIQKGDRIFLIRLGCNPRGIVASGFAITDVFPGIHWDSEKAALGKPANRVYIRFDKIIPDGSPILSMEDLKILSEKMMWSSQTSGISIAPEIAEKLEQEWSEY